MPAQTTLDIGLVLQIGAAILLDKPLLLLVPPGVTPSRKLRAIADEIMPIPVPQIDGSLDEKTIAAVTAAIFRITSEANTAVQ